MIKRFITYTLILGLYNNLSAMEQDSAATTKKKMTALIYNTQKPKTTPQKNEAANASSACLSQSSTEITKKSKRKLDETGLDQMLDAEKQMIAEKSKLHPLLEPQKGFAYNAQRTRNMYPSNTTNNTPSSSSCAQETFALSRSKIEDFIKCRACFYLDRKLGTTPPPGFPFSLNIAVDNNMKNEFDIHRKHQTMHPYCIAYDLQAEKEGRPKLHAVPFQHPDIDAWRNSRTQGLRYKIPGTNIELHGGIDDIWQNQVTKELILVDYKATSKKGAVSLDAPWQNGYKRQMTIYQYLARKTLEKDGFKVSNTGCFVYGNAQAETQLFNDQLKFQTPILTYEGDDSWVEPTVREAEQCLQANKIPAASQYCNICQFVEQRNKHEAEHKDE
jgi:hypothetical protein